MELLTMELLTMELVTMELVTMELLAICEKKLNSLTISVQRGWLLSLWCFLHTV